MRPMYLARMISTALVVSCVLLGAAPGDEGSSWINVPVTVDLKRIRELLEATVPRSIQFDEPVSAVPLVANGRLSGSVNRKAMSLAVEGPTEAAPEGTKRVSGSWVTSGVLNGDAEQQIYDHAVPSV